MLTAAREQQRGGDRIRGRNVHHLGPDLFQEEANGSEQHPVQVRRLPSRVATSKFVKDIRLKKTYWFHFKLF